MKKQCGRIGSSRPWRRLWTIPEDDDDRRKPPGYPVRSQVGFSVLRRWPRDLSKPRAEYQSLLFWSEIRFHYTFFIHLTWRDGNPISKAPEMGPRLPRVFCDSLGPTVHRREREPVRLQPANFSRHRIKHKWHVSRVVIWKIIVFGGYKLQSGRSSQHTHQNRGKRQSYVALWWLIDSFGCKWGACRDV